MISKDRLLFIAVLVSVIGTASLFLLTASSGVDQASISEIDEDYVGRAIKIQGTVAEVSSYEDTVYIDLKEKGFNDTLQVKLSKEQLEQIDEKEEIKPGAVITAKGMIDEYKGQYNLEVKDSYGIKLEKNAYYSYIQISSLLENPEWYEGMNIKVRGEVVSIGESYGGSDLEICTLGGGYKQVNCHIKDWPQKENVTILKKTPVVVKGEYKYDSYTGRWEIVSDSSPEIYSE